MTGRFNPLFKKPGRGAKRNAFLNYNQMISGIAVFQGQVQIAVNASGEVLSVMEGLVIPEGKMDTTPNLTEAEALAEVFRYAAREVQEPFEMIEARPVHGERAKYQTRSVCRT